jgi:hypothetical protein
LNNKENLIILALQQRIGEMTANYEMQIALLRAELTNLIDLQNDKKEAVEDYSKSIESLIGENNG